MTLFDDVLFSCSSSCPFLFSLVSGDVGSILCRCFQSPTLPVFLFSLCPLCDDLTAGEGSRSLGRWHRPPCPRDSARPLLTGIQGDDAQMTDTQRRVDGQSSGHHAELSHAAGPRGRWCPQPWLGRAERRGAERSRAGTAHWACSSFSLCLKWSQHWRQTPAGTHSPQT